MTPPPQEYADIAEKLLALNKKRARRFFPLKMKTDLRKKVQQTARAVLPNETEAPIIVTGNARAWRHFLEMRANPHAETEIRALAFRTYLCLASVEPILFGDYEVLSLKDGTFGVQTAYVKV